MSLSPILEHLYIYYIVRQYVRSHKIIERGYIISVYMYIIVDITRNPRMMTEKSLMNNWVHALGHDCDGISIFTNG